MSMYTEIIRLDPAQPDALHLLGVALTQCGQPERGSELIEKSLAVNPIQYMASANLGNALLAMRRFEAALGCFDRSLAMCPDFAPAHNGRGSALAALGRHEDSLACFDRALRLQPEFPEALSNRGAALFKLKRSEEAIRAYDRIISARPEDATALTNRAAAFQEQSRYADALADCDRALSIVPALIEARYLRCAALRGLKRLRSALGELDRMLELEPGHAAAMVLRGHVLRELGRSAEAAVTYRQALRVRADYPEALMHLGTLAMAERRYDQAVEAFKGVLRQAPSQDFVHGQDFVRGALLHAQLHLFEWSDYAAGRASILAELDAGGKPDQPLSFLAISDCPERQLECARRLHQTYPQAPAPPRRAARGRRARIRLAYVSADFLEHPMAYLLAGLFEAHDRKRFDVTAISLRADQRSPTAQRLQRAFERFIDVSDRSDAEIAGLIRDLDVDIAVDLMGCTAEDRPAILRSRPAPVQVNYIGFPGSMGAEHIDYIVADRYVIPPQNERFFSECIAYLPDCFQANDSRRARGGGATRSAMGLPDEDFVWCSFHGSFKINPPLFDVWARLLEATPRSVLWLVAASARAETNLREEAQRRGIDPQRLIFAKRVPYPEHLARLALADLCLDTWPFNGGATTSDALWTGVPVISCAGRAFASRMSGSLLHAVGLPELITENFADYERLAVRLASNPDELAALRSKLHHGRAAGPLFDTDRFRRHLEAAFDEMWERHLRGEAPASFIVPG
jgi:predicted O-linked N-acetylglucosamine transferase (SPINDLY family)